MNKPTRHARSFAPSREDDQHIPTADNETGWWDDTGRPAPWPADFLDPEAGWSNGNTTIDDANDPGNQPF